MRFLFSFNRGFLVTMSVWAKVGGLIAAVTITAAAQLWEFPHPRSLLLNLGLQCGLIALNLQLWSSSASAVLPSREGDAKWGLEILVAAPLLLFLAYTACFVSEPLYSRTRGLMECANIHAPDICTMKNSPLWNDKAEK